MLDMPLSARIDEYRRKQQDGSITDEEYKEAVRLMREGRVAAATVRATKRKAEMAAVDSDAIMDELKDL